MCFAQFTCKRAAWLPKTVRALPKTEFADFIAHLVWARPPSAGQAERSSARLVPIEASYAHQDRPPATGERARQLAAALVGRLTGAAESLKVPHIRAADVGVWHRGEPDAHLSEIEIAAALAAAARLRRARPRRRTALPHRTADGGQPRGRHESRKSAPAHAR